MELRKDNTGPIIIRSGRNPYEIWPTVGFLFNGIYSLLFSPASNTLQEELPRTGQVIWAIQIMFGAALVLYGLYYKDMLVGLKWERIGCFVQISGSATYLIVLCMVSTFARGGMVMTITVLFAIAAYHRTRQIKKDLRDWTAFHLIEGASDGE